MLKIVLGWLTSGPLDRILSSVDHKIDNATERERVKAGVVEKYLEAQASIAGGRQWWFPLFFIVPLGAWFSAVCIYSVLFCRTCVLPQAWSIAALPPPLDNWGGAIVTSLFIGRIGERLISSWGTKS